MTDFHVIAQNSKASQDKWELDKLLVEIEKITPKRILEIGVHLGHSMRVWKEAFNPEFLLGLEKDTYCEYPDLHVLKGVDSHVPEVLEEVQKRLRDRQLDFLFIDADHSYEGVKRDFFMYTPLVRMGGIVALHDIGYHHHGTEEVDIFWKELCSIYKDKAVSIRNPSGEGTGVGLIYL